MLYRLFVFDHQTLHICFWTLPALITGGIMVVMGLVHGHKQKKREKEFEEQLEEKLNEAAQETEAAEA